jgi:hypothetical protein
MITIRFSGPFVQDVTLGPAPFFQVDRDALRQGSARRLIARHTERAWLIGTRLYSGIEVLGCQIFVGVFDEGIPVGECRVLGPYGRLQVLDGIAYGDGRELRLLADVFHPIWTLATNDTRLVVELRSDRHVSGMQ